MPNFAIFGGTFNPVHWGHLLIAETAYDQFGLDRVIWVPSVRPPHKAQPLASFEHRLEMVGRAIADQPAFTTSAVDRQRQGTSYAIGTLHALQALEPNARWYWIIGNDAFQSLPQWRASQELVAQCRWLVAPRAGGVGVWGCGGVGGAGEAGGAEEERGAGGARANEGKKEAISSQTHPSSLIPHPSSPIPHPPSSIPTTPHTPTPHWHPLQMPSVAISSSLIRQRCREGRSIRYLVPEAVRCYIVEQALYQMS